MYLEINGTRHAVKRRIVSADTVKYTFVTPEPSEISGTIKMFRDDGFLLSEDNADSYQRKTYTGTLLTLTNAPEVEPVPQPPTLESRVTAIENAIEKGLSL